MAKDKDRFGMIGLRLKQDERIRFEIIFDKIQAQLPVPLMSSTVLRYLLGLEKSSLITQEDIDFFQGRNKSIPNEL